MVFNDRLLYDLGILFVVVLSNLSNMDLINSPTDKKEMRLANSPI
jgi:hypothetical protein